MDGAAPVAAQAKPRPYKKFWNSAFHSRFVHTFFFALFICWDQAVALAPRYGTSLMILFLPALTQVDLFWCWFPIGPAGVRAVLYLISILFVFLLQVSTLTEGAPTLLAPIQKLRRALLSWSTFQIILFYVCSASWFTEVYIWSGGNKNLAWVIKGDRTTHDTLNEQPIWLRAFFMQLGFAQGVKHIYGSLSTLRLPVADAPSPQAKDQRTHPASDIYTTFREAGVGMLSRSIISSAAVSVIGPFFYTQLLRQPLWKLHLAFAKPWFNLSRSHARAEGLPPIFGTLPTTIFVGFWLCLAWEFSALSLLVYFRNPPVKNDQPWTSSGKDPNGSLLSGMKAKRGLLKTFAFWELVIIAQNHPERRKLIFADIERPIGPVWSQMLVQTLKVLQAIDDRIQPPTQSPTTATQQPVESLPKILKESSDLVRTQEQKAIIAPGGPRGGSARQRIMDIADDKFRQLGSHPETIRIPEMPNPAALGQGAKGYFSWLFKTTSAAKINAIVLNSPNSDAAIIVDAIESTTRMLTCSLQDDAFGRAMSGVPDAVKQFTMTIELIEGLLHQSPPDGDISEVRIVLNRLRQGLSELLSAFQMFLSDTGLGIADLNRARKASGLLEAEKEEQKRIEEAPRRREPLPATEDEGSAPRPEESWREWNKPKRTTKLFPSYTGDRPQRKSSGGTGANGTARRPREMEQVR
jgi:nucleoporin NDC1